MSDNVNVIEVIQRLPQELLLDPLVASRVAELESLRARIDAVVRDSRAECVSAVLEGWDDQRAAERRLYWTTTAGELARAWEQAMERFYQAAEKAMSVL